MANFNVPENPKFTDSLQQLSTSDRCHAGVFNAIYEKLFHNDLFLKAKAAVMETEIAQAIAIALGRNQALVFETYDAMAAWFADKENTAEIAALANGTNLYIVDTGVPDYWWSSDAQQYYQLETQKADLTKYDNIIGKKDIAALSDDGTITGALVTQNNNFTTLNQNLGGLSFYEDATGKYVIGADSVPKKLGSPDYAYPLLPRMDGSTYTNIKTDLFQPAENTYTITATTLNHDNMPLYHVWNYALGSFYRMFSGPQEIIVKCTNPTRLQKVLFGIRQAHWAWNSCTIYASNNGTDYTNIGSAGEKAGVRFVYDILAPNYYHYYKFRFPQTNDYKDIDALELYGDIDT